MRLYEEHEYCGKEKEPPRLYRIGMFAKLNRVTIKTLRYYDEQGLLKPEYVDEETGYRYYLATQTAQVHQIVAMKKMGFSLEEIRKIMAGASDKSVLLSKKHEILQEIARLTETLAQIESYLTREDLDLSAPVLIKTLPEVIVATMESRIDSYDALFDCMPCMGDEMERLGCVCEEPDYCFTMYTEESETEEQVRIETCEAVTKQGQDSELVKFKILPKVEMAACMFHKGTYDTLSQSYERVLRFIEENGYEICGNIRESYIDGVWNKEKETDWLTEIQIPVKKSCNL